MRTRVRAALRWASWLGLGAALTGGAAVAALFFLSQGDGPPAGGEIRMEGLRGPVAITRDLFGVPHIEAESIDDAFLGLGFAHAQDRLWQMEMLRREASGTLSELFGHGTLARDRLARTLGLRHDAQQELERLPRPVRRQLERYAAGVNRWLREVRSTAVPRPFEVRWLGVEFADWSAADTLAIVRLRAWALSRSLSASLLLERLRNSLGGVASQVFFPVPPAEGRPELMSGLRELQRIGDRVAADLGLPRRSGSLGLVVGASHSVSGRPMLANDPHTGFRMPPLFYLAHLRAPGLELGGATWPGVPVFWTGTNLDTAWGQVALHASTSDLYMEMLHPTDSHRYDRNGVWLDAARRSERIDVRYGEPEEIEVIVTRHGPLLGSVLPEDPSVRNYALRWVGHHSRSGIEAVLRIQRARNWEDFREALRGYPAPLATFLFAHRDGTIGSQLAGHLPIRAIDTGLLPVIGSSRYYDWRGFTGYNDLPSRSGKDIGWIAASTHPDPTLFVSPVKWLWRAGGARERLRDLVRERAPLDLDGLVEIQRDTRSTRAVRVVARLLEGSERVTGTAERVRRILLEWDGSTAVDSTGASVYHAFRQVLTRRALEAHLGSEFDFTILTASDEPVPGALLDRFVERLSGKQARALVGAALEETWDWLGVNVSANPRRWAWGELHTVRPQHAFERFGSGFQYAFGRWLGRGPFAVPGDADSVWTMHHAALPGRQVEVEVGPALRYAVDLAYPDHARVGLAGGQSGHPGTPHYDDALADWLAGRPRLLWMDPGDVARLAVGRWVLQPELGEAYP